MANETQHHDEHHEHGHGHGDGHHGVGHVVPVRYLAATAAALLVLTWVTVAAAKFDFREYDLYEMNIIVALAIACVKASLVCLFFMHLRWDKPFNAFVLVGSLAFVALMIGFSVTDTRAYRENVEVYNQQVLRGGDVKLAQDRIIALDAALEEADGEGHGPAEAPGTGEQGADAPPPDTEPEGAEHAPPAAPPAAPH